ncbi:hypothetical protein NsoK4_05520 [Nitrosopumilus sp. K4]|uniref:hypothetical protein n=1 Tax=Nitrosopumilus sp. K4 TaxID=2795383 RepID=UPI001BA58087|nr:hypothetical protein [Nitrosopumilus sp. K4]QUC63923.1 hypothetical protein NsoK4_05520 [Nitrosopumilus sp. K4]
MINALAQNIVSLKKEFSKTYSGSANIQEVIPLLNSETFQIEQNDLDWLHTFAKNNPIYYNSYEQKISDVNCIVYEGDINKYWLNSIQHGSSRAPFSPTWILSAYVMSLHAKELGFDELIDVGSGDGRIAFCAKVLGMDSFSFEIDNMLVDLQKSISDYTGIEFDANCTDATTFDYSHLNLKKPLFFIGGLAQMGGISLATGVLDNLKSKSESTNTGMVFAGTFSQKYPPDPMSKAGWGTLIHKYGLQVIDTVILPSAWTFRELDDTPYVFTRFDA